MDARSVRLMRRTYNRTVRSEDLDGPCVICLESMNEENGVPLTTICGHVFHGDCWRRYTTTYFLRADEVVTELDLQWFFLLTYAGAPCPLCRTSFPFLNRFAYAVQDRKTMEPMHGIEGLDLDCSLALATTRD